MVQKIYLIDVAGYLYRAYFAIPSMTNSRGSSTNALYGFIRSVLKLIKDFSPDHIVAVFDGPDNKKQRTEIYEKYKIHRSKAPGDLPAQMDLAKVFCEYAGIPHIEVPGVEADDTMGSIAVWAAKLGAQVFICTSDKDLCQLVNDKIAVLNTYKDNLIVDAEKVEEIYGVPPHQIVDWLALTGDSSDNIPGVTGFGPKTASSLLKEFGSLEEILKNPTYVSGLKKQQALIEEADNARLSKRLATIYIDIDFPKDTDFFIYRGANVSKLKEFYLEMSFNSLVKELDEGGIQSSLQPVKTDTPSDYHLVNDESSLMQLLQLLKSKNAIAFSVETTMGHPLLVEMIGIGFSIHENQAYYIPLNGFLNRTKVIAQLKELFSDPHLHFICHNCKHDCHILANEGITPINIFFDTLLASYILNSHSHKHSLDQLMLQMYGKVKTPIKELIGSGKKETSMKLVDLTKMCNYCCEDVDYTLRLYIELKQQLVTRNLTHLHDTLEFPLTKVLYKMERAGIFLNADYLHKMSIELNRDLKLLEEEIYALAGINFNISSPKQLSSILFERLGIKPLKKTATGLSTNVDVLEMLSGDYPIAAKIIEFRVLEKLRSTYVDTLPQEINSHTHRVHCTFNQSVAATGRLACQNPNLQNIPVRTELGRKIREAFRPEKEGWSFLAADYSQIELRLLAHLSEDPNLIAAFSKGEDIHAFTASLMFDIPLEQVTKQQRHQAKAINFGIIYGQQAFGLSKELGIEVNKAATFIESYFQRYTAVRQFLDQCKEFTRKTNKSVTMIGREREIPEIHSSNAMIRQAAERLAINTPLQGTAADLIKLAMLKIDQELEQRRLSGFMILQIHDELIFEVPNHELDEFKLIVKNSMEHIFDLKVPLVVDLVVGKNWKEC